VYLIAGNKRHYPVAPVIIIPAEFCCYRFGFTMKVVYILHTARKYDGSSKSFCLMFKGLIQKGVAPTIILPEYGALCDIFEHEPYFLSCYPPLNKTVKRRCKKTHV